MIATRKAPKVHGCFLHAVKVDTLKDKVKDMEEVWKDVPGFEGAYQISNHGRVRSIPRRGTRLKEIRTISYTRDGYARIRLIFKEKDVTVRIHRLVAEAFIPKVEGKDTVNHIDGNKLNNHAENLEWADRSEQMFHAYSNDLKKPMCGETNGNAKLTAEQVEAIRKEYVRYSKEHGTVALGKKYGVNNSTIGAIVRGVTYA